MIYPYRVKHNGIVYAPGTEVPESNEPKVDEWNAMNPPKIDENAVETEVVVKKKGGRPPKAR